MTEPKRLRRGNAFQKIVQADFIANAQGGGVECEFLIDFGPRSVEKHPGPGTPGTGRSGEPPPELVLVEVQKQHKRNKIGRLDIWIEDRVNDAIAVYEIKATDWDLITPRNVRRNIYRHQKQLLDYVYRYYFRDSLQVTYGLIYPYPPEREGLRDEIEELAMMTFQVPVYWYTELNPGFNPLLLSI